MALIDSLASNLAYIAFRFSRNKSQHTIDAADTTLLSRAGLKYYLELQVPQYKFFGDFLAIHRSEGREVPVLASQDGSTYEGATFTFNDRGGKLDGNLEFIKPIFALNKMMVVVNQTLQFKLRELVQQDLPAVNTDTTYAAEWIIKAGLSPVDYSELQSSFFTNYQANAKQFLTWQPNNIFVGKEDRWLSFLINFSPKPSTVKLKVRCHKLDNTDTVSVVESLTNLSLGQIIVCPVGVEQLEIPDDVLKYDVWLSNEADLRISEVRTYFVDREYRLHERAITFVNSLGGWDTIRFTGQSNENLRVNRQKVERERPANATIDFADSFLINVEGEEELIVSTGVMERQVLAKQRHIQDLLFSERIYLQTPRGHQYLDLITNQIEKKRDNTDIVAYSFNFRKSGIYQNHSDCEPANIISSRPTGWRGIDYDHILDSYGKRTGKVKARRLEKIYTDTIALYKPYTVKPNVSGTEGYVNELILPNAAAVLGTTPFPSAEIDRAGSFLRTACAAGGTPGFAEILVIAGKYGGEKAGDADVSAEAEAQMMDTQAYADANGACYPDPWSYAAVVAVNKARFRINTPRTPGYPYGGNYIIKSDAFFGVQKGNAWHLQLTNAGQADVYQDGVWDIELPTTFAPTENWRFGVYGGAAVQIKVYVDGVVIYTANNSADPEGDNFVEHQIAHALIPSQSKVYILIS